VLLYALPCHLFSLTRCVCIFFLCFFFNFFFLKLQFMRIKMYIFGGDCVGPKEPRMTARVPINGMGSLERTCTCIRHSSNSSSSADTSSLRAHWTQPVARSRGVRLQRRCRLSLPLCCYFFGFYFSTNVTAVLQRVTYTKGRSIEAVSEWYVRAQSVVLDGG